MKPLRIFQLSLASFMMIILYCSCQKEGVEGVQGVPGEKGQKGDTGEQGNKGDTGTANVIYSDWFTPDTYTLTTVFSIKNLDYTKAVPAITQDIVDKGVVIVYGRLSGYNTLVWPVDQVGKLPIILNYISGDTQADTWSAYETPFRDRT